MIQKTPEPIPEILFDQVEDFPNGLADIVPVVDMQHTMRVDGGFHYVNRVNSLSFQIQKPITTAGGVVVDGPVIECDIFPLSNESPRTTDNCGKPSELVNDPKLILAALLKHGYCLNNEFRKGEHFYLVPSDPAIIAMRDKARADKRTRRDLDTVKAERSRSGYNDKDAATVAKEMGKRAAQKETAGIGTPPPMKEADVPEEVGV